MKARPGRFVLATQHSGGKLNRIPLRLVQPGGTRLRVSIFFPLSRLPISQSTRNPIFYSSAALQVGFGDGARKQGTHYTLHATVWTMRHRHVDLKPFIVFELNEKSYCCLLMSFAREMNPNDNCVVRSNSAGSANGALVILVSVCLCAREICFLQ